MSNESKKQKNTNNSPFCSQIYTKLNLTNIYGLVAYGLYKQTKRVWVEKILEQEKRLPTIEECESFEQSQLHIIESYQHRANDLVTTFVANLMQESAVHQTKAFTDTLYAALVQYNKEQLEDFYKEFNERFYKNQINPFRLLFWIPIIKVFIVGVIVLLLYSAFLVIKQRFQL
jgi:hypothetical protein